ncbi:hypothetical protein EVAR_10873_1 [Eumeta japonica]|uniref:Uncharacterized protein n=1 Tax=Eumeta variegata TaxID=151549 RepID=A0A4C1USQ2_EUMVA|nr:hypothetical protein EVAR_10873_1 [Eumeta japonica]
MVQVPMLSNGIGIQGGMGNKIENQTRNRIETRIWIEIENGVDVKIQCGTWIKIKSMTGIGMMSSIEIGIQSGTGFGIDRAIDLKDKRIHCMTTWAKRRAEVTNQKSTFLIKFTSSNLL